LTLLAFVFALTLPQLVEGAFRGERVTSADAARVEYQLAFSEWMDSQNVGGDSALATAAAKRAMASVDRAIALDPALVPAHVLRSRIGFVLMFHGAMPMGEARALMTESFTAAKKLAPDDALVTSLEAAFLYYGSQGREPGRALLRKSIDGLAARSDDEAKLWLPVVWSWYGVMLLGEGDMEQARMAFESALAVRPDYEYVRSAMLPMTAVVDAGTAPKFGRDGWTPFVADEEGDGKGKGLPDLRGVAWRAEGDRVWFLFGLAAAPDPAHIGMNLAIDLDGDPANGGSWWAGNRGFRYDRVVTVWVARGADGKYRGSSGVADAADIVRGRFTTSAPGAVAFAVDAENHALLVGVPRDRLKGRMRVVATVGTNTDWNDVAPAEGAALLELH
jgi:tetratricopeptide (TPR) repeat protein